MSRLLSVHRFAPFLALFALVFASLGCFEHYQVISKSGPPSALVGATALYIQYDSSHVAISDKRMSEEQWLTTREKDEHRQTYLETKDSVNTGIVEGLQKKLGDSVQLNLGQAPAGAIQITVSYTEWEEGMYAAVVAWPSKVTARVIFSRDGQTVDEIEVKTQENATIYTPAPQQRFHTCGQRLGQFAAEYIVAAGG